MVRGSIEAFSIAAFFDLENVVIGLEEQRDLRFDVNVVLKRLLDKGNVVVKKAYADFKHFSPYKRPFHEAAIELIDIPGSRIGGKNSADIKMVVDALEFSFTKPHIDTFALISGDSDFSPLVSKLRENGKYTIGIGVKKSSSHLLIDNCDEFIFYDDLIQAPAKPRRKALPKIAKKKQEAFDHLIDAIAALERDDRELHSSLIKDTIKRKQPQFNEGYHGYSSFTRLLEDAQRQGLIKLRKDARSGTYVVDDVYED